VIIFCDIEKFGKQVRGGQTPLSTGRGGGYSGGFSLKIHRRFRKYFLTIFLAHIKTII
jgi:hypothetical protein